MYDEVLELYLYLLFLYDFSIYPSGRDFLDIYLMALYIWYNFQKWYEYRTLQCKKELNSLECKRKQLLIKKNLFNQLNINESYDEKLDRNSLTSKTSW